MMNTWHMHTGNIDRSDKRFFFSNLSQPDAVIELAAGQGWGVKGKRRQQSLLCFQGRVWVTQECDIRDYLLEAGDAFLITLPGLVLARALTPARIGYVENLAPEPFSGPFRLTVFN